MTDSRIEIEAGTQRQYREIVETASKLNEQLRVLLPAGPDVSYLLDVIFETTLLTARLASYCSRIRDLDR